MSFSGAKSNIKKEYSSIDKFLKTWNDADKKTAIINELVDQGILIDELKRDVGKDLDEFDLTKSDIDDFIDYVCTIGRKCKIHYLWRPYLNDPKDDLILELALNSQSDYIITYNKKDFKGIKSLGINVVNAKEFLQLLGEI